MEESVFYDRSEVFEGDVLFSRCSAPRSPERFAYANPLPSVIERTNNTIIAHGWLDFLMFMNGSLVTVLNMTWNGLQGFQTPPTEPLYVPYHYGLDEVTNSTIAPRPFTLDAGAGHLGIAHTERGLTFTTVYLAGHEIPRYAPGAAYRQLEFFWDESRANPSRESTQPSY
ncbi:uncharacterized protein ATNIH1004_011571 [Aspergillus tanneri]|uniref:Uncharacterized protein n=1 Tax=Aspergillus tanneri TaxID=1220188 RepID=A0A5M9MAC5_9EURO|nr:uncharacterized protein ATNIH1004_011571 [Aspergillus tanneri]KAA8642626.1 hypothetical protein ATNIH1004_011571 [Aspergillus tanneri]